MAHTFGESSMLTNWLRRGRFPGDLPANPFSLSFQDIDEAGLENLRKTVWKRSIHKTLKPYPHVWFAFAPVHSKGVQFIWFRCFFVGFRDVFLFGRGCFSVTKRIVEIGTLPSHFFNLTGPPLNLVLLKNLCLFLINQGSRIAWCLMLQHSPDPSTKTKY